MFQISCAAAVINALLIALALEKKDELTRNFERLEEIWDAYRVYTNREEP